MSIPKDGHGPSIFKHLPLPWVARADSWDGYVVRSSNGAVVINFGQAFQGYAECFGLSKIVSQAICDAVNAANDEDADAHRPADELDHAIMEHVALEPLRKALASIIKGLTNPETPDATVPPETGNDQQESISLFVKHPRPWEMDEYCEAVDSNGNRVGCWQHEREALVEFINLSREVPPSTLNHDNHAMLARRVGELECAVETIHAALRSARLIFDGVGDA